MIRIISGKHHGRHLTTPPGKDVRPTSDRVKTALFNILGPWIVDKTVLELFAGVGGVGFECLSRGASRVTFVEQAAVALDCLMKNATQLDEKQAIDVVPLPVETMLERHTGEAFDFIFADPPYRDAHLRELLDSLAASLAVKPETIVIIEHGSKERLVKGWQWAGWECYRVSRYGKTALSFFSRLEPHQQAHVQ